MPSISAFRRYALAPDKMFAEVVFISRGASRSVTSPLGRKGSGSSVTVGDYQRPMCMPTHAPMSSKRIFCTLAATVLFSGSPTVIRAQERGDLPGADELGKRWRLVGSTDFAVIYIDTARVKTADTHRSDVWLFLHLHSRSPSPGGWFDRTIDHVRVNCSTSLVEGLYSSSWYDRETHVRTMGTGQLQVLPSMANSTAMAMRICKVLRPIR